MPREPLMGTTQMHGYLPPIDSDCPEVQAFRDALAADPMSGECGIDIAEVEREFLAAHSPKCHRCNRCNEEQMPEPVKPGFAIAENGRVFAMIPDGETVEGFWLYDLDDSFCCGQGLGCGFEPVAADDPRITAEDRDNLQWMIDDYLRTGTIGFAGQIPS